MTYLFMAEGTEEVEAIAVYDLLKRGGVDVKTVGVPGKTLRLSHGLRVECDLALGELPAGARPEAVVLPGGMPGTKHLEAEPAVLRAVTEADGRGAVVAAICAAPSVLGHLGVLRGKTAVCYPGFESELHGAKSSDLPVVRDGNVITAVGAGAAIGFAAEILAALKGRETADEILRAIRAAK